MKYKNYLMHTITLGALCSTALTSATIVKYIELEHEQTGHIVELYGDMHVKSSKDPELILRQRNDLRARVKNLEGSKEVIVEDMQSFLAGLNRNGECLSWQSIVMDFIARDYNLMNIPAHNVEFRIVHHPEIYSEDEKQIIRAHQSAVIQEVLSYDDGPQLNSYYREINNNISSSTVDDESARLNLEAFLLDRRICHRLHDNKIRGIKNSVVIAGEMHTDEVVKVLKKCGYSEKRHVQGFELLGLVDQLGMTIKVLMLLLKIKIGAFSVSQYLEFFQNHMHKLALDISALDSNHSEA